MKNEATPVKLVYLNQDDRLRNRITMLKEVDGNVVVHLQIDGSKIIDGNDLIINQEIVS